MQHSSVSRRMPRRRPIATVSVLAVTAALTVLQYPFPQVRLALWRDPAALAAGQWWRLVTPLFVQYDAIWQIVVVFAGIAGVGVLAERIFGHGWWLLLYLGCGVVGQAFGYLWAPPDAGASVAGAGLVGAVCAWLLSPAGPRQAQVRVWGVVWPLAGIALCVYHDMHGPPLLVGFGLGALLLWLHRRRHAGQGPAMAAGPGPPPGSRQAQPHREASSSHPGRPGPGGPMTPAVPSPAEAPARAQDRGGRGRGRDASQESLADGGLVGCHRGVLVAVIGVAASGVAVVASTVALRSERGARTVGRWADRLINPLTRRLARGRSVDLTGKLLNFRSSVIGSRRPGSCR